MLIFKRPLVRPFKNAADKQVKSLRLKREKSQGTDFRHTDLPKQIEPIPVFPRICWFFEECP